MTMKAFFLTSLSVLTYHLLNAQERIKIKSLEADKIDHDLKIDGLLNEPDWVKAREYSDFQLNYPSDTAMASGRTIVKVLYNDRYLYIGAKLFNGRKVQNKYVVSSLKRDFT